MSCILGSIRRQSLALRGIWIGFDRCDGDLNDLWKFDPTTHEWTWISGSNMRDQAGTYGTKGTAIPLNVPGARGTAVSWIYSSGRLWLFGGIGSDSAGNSGGLNDLWKFDPTDLEWTWVSGSGTIEGRAPTDKGYSQRVERPGGKSRARILARFQRRALALRGRGLRFECLWRLSMTCGSMTRRPMDGPGYPAVARISSGHLRNKGHCQFVERPRGEGRGCSLDRFQWHTLALRGMGL